MAGAEDQAGSIGCRNSVRSRSSPPPTTATSQWSPPTNSTTESKSGHGPAGTRAATTSARGEQIRRGLISARPPIDPSSSFGRRERHPRPRARPIHRRRERHPRPRARPTPGPTLGPTPGRSATSEAHPPPRGRPRGHARTLTTSEICALFVVRAFAPGQGEMAGRRRRRLSVGCSIWSVPDVSTRPPISAARMVDVIRKNRAWSGAGVFLAARCRGAARCRAASRAPCTRSPPDRRTPPLASRAAPHPHAAARLPRRRAYFSPAEAPGGPPRRTLR
jgi:hypothetical protein